MKEYHSPAGIIVRRAGNRVRSKALRARRSPEERKRVHDQRWGRKIRQFSVTPADYDARLKAQGGVCAICGLEETQAMKKHLNIDHDHETGLNRGLLCNSCNVGLGHFQDSEILLRLAIAYLRRSRTNPWLSSIEEVRGT